MCKDYIAEALFCYIHNSQKLRVKDPLTDESMECVVIQETIAQSEKGVKCVLQQGLNLKTYCPRETGNQRLDIIIWMPLCEYLERQRHKVFARVPF